MCKQARSSPGVQPPFGSTQFPGSESGLRPPDGCSPWSRPFPPRPPPEVAFHCSVASQVIWPGPTSHSRACSAFGSCLPEPAQTEVGAQVRSGRLVARSFRVRWIIHGFPHGPQSGSHSSRFHKSPFDPGQSDFPSPVLASALSHFSETGLPETRRCLSARPHSPRHRSVCQSPRRDFLDE